MGVLYAAGDDVEDLLIPFVREHGKQNFSNSEIEQVYNSASLGEIDAAVFWEKVGVDPALEDLYLSKHTLMPDAIAILPLLRQGFDLCCLSNDVAAWSLKLRRRFGLEQWIDDWVISGEVGIRKPA